MKGMTTNVISFSEKRAYLQGFLHKILEKDTKEKIILNSKLNELLFLLVKKAPSDYKPRNPGENEFVLTLPDWKDLKNEYYFYLNDSSQRIIESFIYTNFWLVFEQHMRELSFIGYKSSVYNFMENYGLDEKNYDMLIRRDRRFRKSLTPENTKKIASVFV